VAVSGQSDEYFTPFLAGSRYAGATGDYEVLVAARPLAIVPTDGPAVLAVDPGTGSNLSGVGVLHASPLAIYVDLSSPIDPTTVSLLQPGGVPSSPTSVQLTFNPTGNFGDGNDVPVALNGFHYAPDAMELQLQIAAPLGPGFYRVTLAGNAGPNFNPVLIDPTDMVDLGQNQDNPTGQDFTAAFQIDGSEGTASAALAGDGWAAARSPGFSSPHRKSSPAERWCSRCPTSRATSPRQWRCCSTPTSSPSTPSTMTGGLGCVLCACPTSVGRACRPC
jgi:hypothetical protein